MPHLGPLELGIILVIVIAVFGAGKLAGLGGALGRAVHDFRKSVRSDETPQDTAEADSSTPGEDA